MHRHRRQMRWAVLAIAVALSALGSAAAPGGAAPMVFYPRPWGFGFGFFPLMILFWIFVIRGLFWRGRWGGGCGYGSRYGGVPPAFDEWHRRAHAQEPRQPQANV